MPALSQADIAFRLELYKRYSDALELLAGMSAVMPEGPPAKLVVTWGERPGTFTPAEEAEEAQFAPRQRTRFVVQRAWAALRKAVLADAEKALADVERDVIKFEDGESVEMQK